MKCLMSINFKFMEYTPKELITLVKENSRHVDGFEIFVDVNDLKQIDYLKELAFECGKYDFHFQVHGDSSLNILDQKKYFNILNEISDQLGYKINVVIHPLSCGSLPLSIEKTTEYTNELIRIADLSKVIISLENLNDIDEQDRLSKNEVIPIVANNENLYFTYDIGHEIADYGNLTNIDKSIIQLISNVHIHTMGYKYSGGFDHKPIYKNGEHWNEVIKGLIFLKNNNYNGSVVFEYDLYACHGENLTEKIVSYANSIDYVAERLL